MRRQQLITDLWKQYRPDTRQRFGGITAHFLDSKLSLMKVEANVIEDGRDHEHLLKSRLCHLLSYVTLGKATSLNFGFLIFIKWGQ